ncbi:DUF6285 domain-containing protein [Nonomuraea sp. NPDC049419]|uniref:DUF6285 domain-containing protein n=1 Tax=Nonomuraea sp. NPDC049419 TaxID=3155772 RepID=UPI00343AD28D
MKGDISGTSGLAPRGVADEAELAEAIRAGRLQGDERLLAALEEPVRAKPAVANPAYPQTR